MHRAPFGRQWRPPAEEVSGFAEEVAEEAKVTGEVREAKEDTRVTKETGTKTAREDGTNMGNVTKGFKEEAQEGMGARRLTREVTQEVKEGTKDGTRQAERPGRKEAVKEASCLIASASASSAAVKGT